MQSSSTRRRRFVYSLGGGLGHLTRALALARAAVRDQAEGKSHHRTEIVLLTNSPFAGFTPISQELGVHHQVVRLSHNLSRNETANRVVDLIRAERFDTLVIDTFPRGLGGELAPLLPNLRCRKVLVHRDLAPKYCSQFRLSHFLHHFDLVVVPGEPASFDDFPRAKRTAPWLIRDQHELLSPREARRLLNVRSDDRPVVAVIGSGRDEEIERMQCFASQLASEFASRAAVRFIAPGSGRRSDSRLPSRSNLTTVHLWPFFLSILGVSIFVGGGGYNCVHEARATRTRYIGLSWPRLYDRQRRRLQDSERAADFEQARHRVRTAIEAHPETLSFRSCNFDNGVHGAIRAIDAL